MPQKDSRWDRYVFHFKNTWIGVTLLAMISIVVFISKTTSLIDRTGARFFPKKADLVVSALDTSNRLLRLPGYARIDRGPRVSPVFTGGFRARFSLAHNRSNDEPIRVTGVRIKIDEFIAGEFPEYDYRVNLDEIIGRGTAEARTFNVTLGEEEVRSAIWVDENGKSLPARTENLLDVEPPKVLTLQSGNDVGEELDITVTANEPGLYKVRFVFEYFVRKDHVQTSSPISFYYKQ